MSKYVLSFAPWVGTKAELTALIKPKRDIIESAKELGYKEILSLEQLHYNKLNAVNEFQVWRRIKRRFFAKFSYQLAVKKNLKILKTFFSSLTKEDILLVQYPIYGDHGPEIFNLLFQEIPKLKIKKTIVIVHDIETLNRHYEMYLTKDEESGFIKSFNYVILHNRSMIDYYSSPEDSCTYFSLDIFDYRLSNVSNLHLKADKKFHSIFYAGNLMKSAFLKDVGCIPCYDFDVYGPNFKLTNLPKNLHFHGELPAEDVIAEGSKYSFGLVWDGDSIDQLTGAFGEYMKYNNPYKLSCNIASGLPIITSHNAGIADFIENNDLGILVDSLQELEKYELSEKRYMLMKNNVLNLRERILKGNVIKDILERIEKIN